MAAPIFLKCAKEQYATAQGILTKSIFTGFLKEFIA
jgi:hypothetical protein